MRSFSLAALALSIALTGCIDINVTNPQPLKDSVQAAPAEAIFSPLAITAAVVRPGEYHYNGFTACLPRGSDLDYDLVSSDPSVVRISVIVNRPEKILNCNSLVYDEIDVQTTVRAEYEGWSDVSVLVKYAPPGKSQITKVLKYSIMSTYKG